MNYGFALEYAYDRLTTGAPDLTEPETAFIAADFADRCTGDVAGFPGLPETDNVADEWSAYLRDIGGFGNFKRYVAGRA